MATYSRVELRDAVLVELGVKDPVEATEAEDAVLADARCQQKLEMLNESGFIPFDLDGEIPAGYFMPLVRVIADTLVAAYGLTDRAAYYASNADRAMRDLCRLKAPPYYGEPTKGVYF